MTSSLNVLAVLRKHAESHRALAGSDAYSAQEAPKLEAACVAVAELIEAGKQLLPRNLCLNNPRWPDSTEIPLTTTLGELRAFAAALANVGSVS